MKRRDSVLSLLMKACKMELKLKHFMKVISLLFSLIFITNISFIVQVHHSAIIKTTTIQYEQEHFRQLFIENNTSNRDDSHSTCLSPESYVPWILDGSCTKHPHRSTFSTTGHYRSCDLCGEDAEYLRNIRDEIALKYEQKCKDLVVYGAALGEKYEQWMRSTEFLGEHNSKVLKRHGTCFFQFVTDINDTGDLISADGSQNLILIDPVRMPYANNRRNTKILKFSPGLLFPWAERVIWQDAKLLNKKNNDLPNSYLLHFNRTIERFGTCSSFMGLPISEATVRNSTTVNLKAHCETIIAAAEERPTVSDDLDALRSQCKRLEKIYSNLTRQSSQVFHQNPLVDTAFIVYDMRSEVCRKFNGDLGCSWLDEIHCYSDRDQISFPHIVANSGLRLSPEMNILGHEFRDRVYIDKNNAPMLHIGKRSCHWYYRSFSRCVTPEGEMMSKSYENKDYTLSLMPTKGLRIAVIIAGTLNRFMFDSTVEHLIRPMIKKDVSVDYYVSLTTAPAKVNRSGTGYTDHLQPDPTLPRSTLEDRVNIEEYIREKIGSNGASIGGLKIQETIDIDSEPMLKARREKSLKDNPNEDPDQKFPMFDNRTEEIARRIANTNRNLLRMHLAIQDLWTSALKWEAEEDFKYDFVFFVREDLLWLADFNIHNLMAKDSDIFIPDCDASNPALEPKGMSDHILISRREVANVFGKYYSTLFHTDVEECMDQLPEKFREDGQRGCNSEMLLKWVADEQKINVTKISQGEGLTFQRSANVKLPDGSILQCPPKFCQSETFPSTITYENKGIETCNNINWDEYFSDE